MVPKKKKIIAAVGACEPSAQWNFLTVCGEDETETW